MLGLDGVQGWRGRPVGPLCGQASTRPIYCSSRAAAAQLTPLCAVPCRGAAGTGPSLLPRTAGPRLGYILF